LEPFPAPMLEDGLVWGCLDDCEHPDDGQPQQSCGHHKRSGLN
jgi:hypothetical protein